MLKRLSQAEEVAEKANTGKNACTTKSLFFCAPRRFLVPEHAGWKAGGRQDCLPHKAKNQHSQEWLCHTRPECLSSGNALCHLALITCLNWVEKPDNVKWALETDLAGDQDLSARAAGGVRIDSLSGPGVRGGWAAPRRPGHAKL